MRKLIAAVLITLTVGCNNHYESVSAIPTIEQGIWGRVELWGGASQMNDPGQSLSGRIEYSSQRIFVFAKTHIEQLTPDMKKGPVYFKRIATNMVATTRSDKRGYYEVSLPAGEYSIFVEVDGRLYANYFDDDGFAKPVEVRPSQVACCGIRIMPTPSDREILAAP